MHVRPLGHLFMRDHKPVGCTPQVAPFATESLRPRAAIEAALVLVNVRATMLHS